MANENSGGSNKSRTTDGIFLIEGLAKKGGTKKTTAPKPAPPPAQPAQPTQPSPAQKKSA